MQQVVVWKQIFTKNEEISTIFFSKHSIKLNEKKKKLCEILFRKTSKNHVLLSFKSNSFSFIGGKFKFILKCFFFSEKFILKQNRFLFCGETCVQRMIVKAFYTKIRTISFTKRNNAIRLKKTFTQVLVFLDTVWNLLKDNFTKKGILCPCLPN